MVKEKVKRLLQTITRGEDYKTRRQSYQHVISVRAGGSGNFRMVMNGRARKDDERGGVVCASVDTQLLQLCMFPPTRTPKHEKH